MSVVERSGGLDREAFDDLLKQILKREDASAPSPEEGRDATPAPAEPAPREADAIREPPAAPPTAAPQTAEQRPADLQAKTPDKPSEDVAEETGREAAAAAPEQGNLQSEVEGLKQRIAGMEAMQARLLEEVRRAAEQFAAAQKRDTSAAEAAAPDPANEPVALERALVRVPDAGRLAPQSGFGLLGRLIALLRRLFPGFFPDGGRGAIPLPAASDALYMGRVELVVSVQDAWGRIERTIEGLASLPGARVHGLYSGAGGEAILALDLDMPATLSQIQAAAPDLVQLHLLAPRPGATRFAVTFA